MLEYLLKGITYGLMLSILIGPIFFALLQAGIEKGIKTGLAIGVGIWISDFLYITTVYLGLSWISAVTALPNFRFYVGIIGGVILIAFGIGTLLNNKAVNNTQKIKQSGYLAYAVKGFLINTFNPFTVFFWVAMSSEVLISEPTRAEMMLFYGGIFGVVVSTDIIKVVLAKQISKYLKMSYILTFRKIVGIILLLGGFILMYRTAFN
jgi:threonine/homoserine/homoserine lactone efflux protein